MLSKIASLTFSLLAVMSASNAFADVILTFDSQNGAPFSQDYGDRVQSTVQNDFSYGLSGTGFTPNVVANYKPGSGFFDNNYGDLVNVVYNQGTTPFFLTLTADAGFEVRLHSFDLAGWLRTDYTIPLVQVSSIVGDSATPLFTQTNVLIEGDSTGPGHSLFDFTLPSPLQAQSLTIIFDDSSVARSNIGIDNIRFSQVQVAITAVPEPSAFALVSLIAVPLLLRKRLRRMSRGNQTQS